MKGADGMSKQWWKAAGIRALRTFVQSMLGLIGTAAALEDVSWKMVISSAILSAILSLLTSLAGLPEVKEE